MNVLRAISVPILVCIASVANAADNVWRTSEDNGCKPGFGFRLIQSKDGVTGSGYLLDPDHPHDFSRGREIKLKITKATERQIKFEADWGDGKVKSGVLDFDAALEAKTVRATLRGNDGGVPIKLVFEQDDSKALPTKQVK